MMPVWLTVVGAIVCAFGDGVSILRQKLAFSGGSYPRALAMYCGYFSAHCPGGARYVHTVYHWYYLFKWAAAHGAAHLPRVVSV